MPSPTAHILDGKAFAEELRGRIALAAAGLRRDYGLVPGLAVVLVGDDAASHVYVRAKAKAASAAGFASFEHRLPAATEEAALLDLVRQLNADHAVHGILVQLPLPEGLNATAIIAAIDPAKDVDGLHRDNIGRLWSGLPGMVPCTPLGCLMLLKAHLGSLAGADAVVIGRSALVGKPMAGLLLAESATVTLTHSRTRDLPDVVRRADILVAAIGRPGFVRGDWIKPGSTVIDVGINRVPSPDGKGRLVGDVAFDEAAQVAGAITPVPGGVGPMTIACLLRNTLVAACRIAGIQHPEI